MNLFRGKRERLDSAVSAIDNVHNPLGINCDSYGTLELSVTSASRSPFCYKISIAIKLLDTIITKVDHINIPRPICTNPYGTLELSVTSASRSPFCYKISIAIKLLDTIILSIIRHIDIAFRINANSARIYKLS